MALVATAAFAQCPADPTTVLAGRWTFQGGPNALTGQLIFRPGSRFITAIVTTVVTATNGNTTQQSNDNASGSYFLNDTCTGGGIYINLPDRSVQWNFTIAPSATFGTVLNFTAIPSTIVAGVATSAPVGTAWPAPTGCPASLTSPVNLLSGTYTAVTLTSVTVSGLAGSSLRGSMDVLAPTTFLGDSRGNVLFHLTPFYPTLPPVPTTAATQLLPIASLTGDPGTYSVQADCERVNMIVDFAWPKPVFYVAYPRLRTGGTIDFVAVGSNALGDALVSTGTISR